MELMLNELKLLDLKEKIEIIDNAINTIELQTKIDILDEKDDKGKNKYTNQDKRDWEFDVRTNNNIGYCELFQSRRNLKHEQRLLEITVEQMKRQFYLKHNQEHSLSRIADILENKGVLIKK